MRMIFTSKVPAPGAYSPGVLIDPLTHDLLFLAGQTANDPNKEGEPIVDGGVGPQTTQTLKNMLAIVEAAGGNAHSFVSMDVFIKDSSDRKGSREEYDTAYRAFLPNMAEPKKGSICQQESRSGYAKFPGNIQQKTL